jgi:hypothetical protein
LAQLHYFAPESEEEKRLRLELGFTISTDEALDLDQMDTDAPPPRSNGVSRPNVMVSTQDSHQPTGTTEIETAPAPSTNDLTLRSEQIADRQAIPHAMITTPNVPTPPIISLESLPPTADAQADEKRAMASTVAPLQAASFLGYPEIPVSKNPSEGVTAATNESSGVGKGQGRADAAEKALEQTGDDEEEPLPEMDSDMDLSDEEGQEDEDME